MYSGILGYQIIITILVISTLNANLRVATRVYDVEGGAIFSKNSTFVFFDGAAWTPRLRSLSPIMAPGFMYYCYTFLTLFVCFLVVSFIAFFLSLFLSFFLSFFSFFLFFFHLFCDNLPCSGMFRNVPECSGMFHVSSFVDAPVGLGFSNINLFGFQS